MKERGTLGRSNIKCKAKKMWEDWPKRLLELHLVEGREPGVKSLVVSLWQSFFEKQLSSANGNGEEGVHSKHS